MFKFTTIQTLLFKIVKLYIFSCMSRHRYVINQFINVCMINQTYVNSTSCILDYHHYGCQFIFFYNWSMLDLSTTIFVNVNSNFLHCFIRTKVFQNIVIKSIVYLFIVHSIV